MVKEVELPSPGTWELDELSLSIRQTCCYEGAIPFELSKNKMFVYTFISPWLPFNKDDYKKFQNLNGDIKQERAFLEELLVDDIMTAFTGVGGWFHERVIVKLGRPTFLPVKFKGLSFMGVKADFIANVKIPPMLGLGHCVAFGCGSVLLQNVR